MNLNINLDIKLSEAIKLGAGLYVGKVLVSSVGWAVIYGIDHYILKDEIYGEKNGFARAKKAKES